MADLAAIERRFQKLRRSPPDLMAASAAALDPGDPRRAHWLAVAQAIAAALDQVSHELPYHNRHHFAEATTAMGLLCRAARAQNLIGAEDAALGVLAMLGHDIDHDGSAVADGRLEAASAARVAAIAASAGATPAEVARIADVILATDPALIARNAASAGDPAGLLCQLANEADVFASLLPSLGPALGELLAEERNLAPDRPARVRERRAFLRAYERFSPAAVAIGLAEQVAKEGQGSALDPPGRSAPWTRIT